MTNPHIKLLRLITRYETDLEHLNKQRHLWLWASSVVFTAIIFLVFYWEWLNNLSSKPLWWVIISLMLLVSINWWYWTMRVVRHALLHQSLELKILKSLITDISSIRQLIVEMKQIHLDKIK